jgi:hypothetical protein
MSEALPAPDGEPRGAHPAVVERRLSPRRACRPAPALCYVPWPGESGRLGHAVDIGPDGIGFLAERPLRPGSVLALQVLEGPPSASLTRVARVVHCAPAGAGRWHIGCAVSPPFTPEEIASLR